MGAPLHAHKRNDLDASPDAATHVFVARQPIFDKRKRVIAYELLFRSGLQNSAGAINRTEAAAHVVSNAVLTFGLDTLIGTKKAFLNFTADHLISGVASLLPKDKVVIELLEDVEPTEAVLAAARHLRKQGYALALDDFEYSPRFEPLLELVQFVKVAFRQSTPAARNDVARRLGGRGLCLLAEQVETLEEYQDALKAGYTYFQGYFFCRPEVVTKREITPARVTGMKLLQALNQTNLNYADMEDIIKRDVSVSHRLLRYINSAWFGFSMRIDSIRHALVLLGENDVRRWVALMALGGLGDRKPAELAVNAAIRGRLCEALAPALGMQARSFDLFLLGAFSMMDAMLDRPMEDAVQDVPLPSEVEQALLGQANPLRDVLNLVQAYEAGRWDDVTAGVALLRLTEDVLPPLYFDAVEWARESFGA